MYKTNNIGTNNSGNWKQRLFRTIKKIQLCAACDSELQKFIFPNA